MLQYVAFTCSPPGVEGGMCAEDAPKCEQENAFSGRENAFSSSQLGADEVVGGECRGEEDTRACGGV